MTPNTSTFDQSNQITTTDATQTTGLEFDPGTYATALVLIDVIALDPDHGDTKTWRKAVTVMRPNSGNAQLVGSIVDLVAAAETTGALLWSISVDASGGAGDSLRVRVTGAASKTIQWFVRFTGELLYMTS